ASLAGIATILIAGLLASAIGDAVAPPHVTEIAERRPPRCPPGHAPLLEPPPGAPPAPPPSARARRGPLGSARAIVSGSADPRCHAAGAGHVDMFLQAALPVETQSSKRAIRSSVRAPSQ